MVSRSAWLLTLSAPLAAYAQDQHAYIQSTRGVQHKPPLISDDFVVGCIMIMFLLLFAFGERAAAAASTLHNTTSFDELTAIRAFAARRQAMIQHGQAPCVCCGAFPV